MQSNYNFSKLIFNNIHIHTYIYIYIYIEWSIGVVVIDYNQVCS